MFIYLLCLSAALLCYTGFQNQSLISLIRSIFSPCSTCCFGLGFSTIKPTCRNTSKDLGHNSRTSFSHRHPPKPGRRGGHPAPRGGHRHHSVYHPNTDEDHGPMRRPPRPVPFRPTMAKTPRLPSVPPRMCYEGRARHAGAQGHRHGVHSLPAPAPPAPPERARDPQQRRHDAGGAHPVSRRLDTTHHPATSTKRPQTCYPHCPATPCPLVHPQTQCTGDRCTTSQAK